MVGERASGILYLSYLRETANRERLGGGVQTHYSMATQLLPATPPLPTMEPLVGDQPMHEPMGGISHLNRDQSFPPKCSLI